MSTRSSPALSVCYTLNNYTAPQAVALMAYPAKYHVFGYEVGESGTPHIQGYIEFEKPTRHTTFRNLFQGVHTETRKGTPKQASDYCKKGTGTPDEPVGFDGFEKGTLPISQKGKRCDLESFKEAIKAGRTDTLDTHSLVWAKHYKFCADYELLHSPARKSAPYVIWLWGKSATGKSRYARELAEERSMTPVYSKQAGKWFGNYRQEPTVVMDDFRPDDIPFNQLLKLLDRYAISVEDKGKTLNFAPGLIIITSPTDPVFAYSTNSLKDGAIEQLTRRLNECICTDPYFDSFGNRATRPASDVHFKRAPKDASAEDEQTKWEFERSMFQPPTI
jgi:hypothetical protein